MAGSPISRESQYADDFLTRQILGPRVSFLLDATTFDAQGNIYWAMPTKGRIVQIKALVESTILSKAPVYLHTTKAALLGSPIIPNFGWTALGAVGTVTVTSATPGVVTWTAHGRKIGDPITFGAATSTPTGITAGTVYYISAFGFGVNSFQIADTYAHAIAATDATDSIGTSSTGVGTITAVSNLAKGNIVNTVYTDTGLQGANGANYAEDTVMVSGVATGLSMGAVAGFHHAVTMSFAAAGVVTWPGSNLAADTPVVFGVTPGTVGALPDNVVAGTTYYVKATNLTANTFKISAAAGDGTAIDTSTGSPSGTYVAYADVAPTAGALRIEITVEPTFD